MDKVKGGRIKGGSGDGWGREERWGKMETTVLEQQ